ncbi:MAG: DUF4363 family protein [Oscillospiraceae bacterium]|jgi:predicted aconitase|nr:DUF4363 family protein [Oscillospiraceae bacterium]
MKLRLIASICLIVFAVGAALFCAGHLEKVTGELTTALRQALDTAEKKESVEQITEKVMRQWEKSENFLHILLPHTNLNELEWTLGTLPDYAKSNKFDLYIEQCIRSIQCVKTIREMEKLSWGNLF